MIFKRKIYDRMQVYSSLSINLPYYFSRKVANRGKWSPSGSS